MTVNNILNVLKNDIRLLTSSVVSIIVILGLCIVPCLYAWFNIFSNWDPYTPDATGRIAVAVANEDEGSDILGLNINVGEKITEGLRENNDIGWVFVSSKKKALDGLYAGDYYAAVVIPEDFSSNVLSFTSSELNHPELDYYENEKKNAIAPKITNKAQQALKEEVDEAFIDTIGRYVSEARAVADASGLDPEDVFSDLGNRTALLGERMDDLVALVTAARGLSDAADELLKASRGLSSSTEDALSVGEQILEDGEELLPDAEKDAKEVSKAVKKAATAIASGLDDLSDALSTADSSLEAFNQFVEEDLDDQKALVSEMAASATDIANRLSKLGLSGLAARFERLADRLNDIYRELDDLEQIDEAAWEQTQKDIEQIQADIRAAADAARSISEDAGSEMDNQITQAIADTRQAIEDLQKTLNESYGNLESLDSALKKSEKALNSLDGGFNISIGSLLDLKGDFTALSGLFDSLADSDDLKNINHLLSDGTEVIAERLASPIDMKTEVIYPVRNFGSMMAPFYTILSLWVGALFAAVLISTKVRRRDEYGSGGELRLHEQFFGRYRLFLVIGIAQALIVSLGDLLYVGIQCHHPILFVIAACIIGMVFMMINYALVFVFGKIGLALSVIIVVLQVAGSGGTFPPEVLPGIFRSLYPFMPFHYALNAMRECVAGMYGHTYLISILILLQFGIVAAALGLLLAKPGEKLTAFVDRAIEDNDLIES
ncbi:MAG: YhgE/Pip family protein [Bacillota bacterium]